MASLRRYVSYVIYEYSVEGETVGGEARREMSPDLDATTRMNTRPAVNTRRHRAARPRSQVSRAGAGNR